MSDLLTPLRLKASECTPYNEFDVDILEVQLRQAGFFARRTDISHAWYKISDDSCASWLTVGAADGPENVQALLRYLEPAI